MMPAPNDTRHLAHLLRRAGFGARPEEWAVYAKLGVDGTADRLLHPELIPDRMAVVQQELGGDYLDTTDIDSLRKWWIYRMAHSQRPLEEKMTLFWHNHFATANYKVNNPQWMWQQNELFRAHALGNFRTLLQAVSRDPAMLVWLDGADNKKGKPNENYGRELQELFTLGVGGGYTETDVKEAARAFTGWRFDRTAGTFQFDPASHDDGEKTFLDQTGPFNGDDIVDILARHPATAKFLCTKLFKFFVHDDPRDAEIAPLTQVYFASGYNIRAVVGTMLKSPSFYSDQAFYNKIKSPTEYVVTTLRTLDIDLSVAGKDTPLGNTLRGMGQDLFNPPNVKGWPEGKSWVNTMTLLSRINFANRVTRELSQRSILTGQVRHTLDAMGLGGPERLATPPQVVDTLWAAFLPGHTPSAATRNTLIAFVQDPKSPDAANFETKAPGLVSLILSAPEYQLA